MAPGRRPQWRRSAALTLWLAGLLALGVSWWWAASSLDSLDEHSALWAGLPPAVWAMVTAAVVSTASGIAACRIGRRGPDARRVGLAAVFVLGGGAGLWAALALTGEKVVTVLQPTATLGCDFSLLVQCGANLSSWQGALLGFPNPLLGVAGWPAVVVIGCAVAAGIPLPRWFWVATTLGVGAALLFVAWLIVQSIFVLGTLCPWCLVTWTATIPAFWATLTHSASRGHLGGSDTLRTVGRVGYGWVPLLTVAGYLLVLVLAQVRLDLLSLIV